MPDFPVILSFGNIANFLECIAMFNFVKRLSALRIVAKPFTDRFPLSDSFAIFLHYVLDVCCFGRGKERLVALRAETDNRIYGSLKPKSVIRKICFLFVIFLLFLQQKSSAKQYN